MAFSANKPLLLHNDLKELREFHKYSFYYKNSESLKEIFKKILSNKALILKKMHIIKDDDKFDFNNQRYKYLSILNINKG